MFEHILADQVLSNIGNHVPQKKKIKENEVRAFSFSTVHMVADPCHGF
jgi:hypothetical protein